MLIVWGENDQIFLADGAEPYKRDLKSVRNSTCTTPGTSLWQLMAIEIARLTREILGRRVPRETVADPEGNQSIAGAAAGLRMHTNCWA